ATLDSLNTTATPSSIIINPANGMVYAIDRSGTILKLTQSGSTTLRQGNSSVPVSSALYDPSNNEFYLAISNSTQGGVEVLDQTGKGIARLDVGVGPVAFALDSANGRIFVANQESNTVTAIDSANNKVVATISVDESPSGICYDASSNYVFETN